MITTTVAGRVGNDAEIRSTQNGDRVASFRVAGDTGFGDRKATIWFDCSLWGKRGESLAPHIRKGDQITVVGELGQREHNGKTYMTLRVSDVALQGGGSRDSTLNDRVKDAPLILGAGTGQRDAGRRDPVVRRF